MNARIPLLPDKEYAFSGDDFERVRGLIRGHAGIDLSEGKQNMVYSRLVRRVRALGHVSFKSYLDTLHDTRHAEWQAFVNCLTTNLTAFHREPHHFEVLAEELRAARPGLPVRIWCCAVSTGEEAYSVCMTVLETLGVTANVTVEASDIDTQVLATAQVGVYPMEAVSHLSEERRRRFFFKGMGGNSGKVRIRSEVSDMVQFRHFNLLGSVWPSGQYDHIFCRNVLIYFDKATQRTVLQRLHQCLRPGGRLYVGHSENFSDHSDLFTQRGGTVYQRGGGSDV